MNGKSILGASLGLMMMAEAALASGYSVERVSFQSNGETLVGNLFIPAGTSQINPQPGVIVTGAWMTVKEQMPQIYAREMAERGFVALAFDFRGWGESGGEPRSMESPPAKAADIVAAAEFLFTRPEVREGAIAGLGVCASAAYMATAATQTGLIRSIGFVAPGIATMEMMTAAMGGPEGVGRMVDVARTAKAAYEATGEVSMLPAASLTDRSAVMFGVPYYTETERGLIPQWENTFNPMTWEDFVAYDPQSAAPELTQPLFYVHSAAATLPDGIRQFAAAVPGEVGAMWLDNVTQFDFYDQPAPVSAASEAVAEHFRATL